MSKKRLSDKDNNAFQFRMRDDELERFIEVLRRAESRQPRASESDVARRLAEIDPDTDGLVTAEDIAYFRGRNGNYGIGGGDLKQRPPKKPPSIIATPMQDKSPTAKKGARTKIS